MYFALARRGTWAKFPVQIVENDAKQDEIAPVGRARGHSELTEKGNKRHKNKRWRWSTKHSLVLHQSLN